MAEQYSWISANNEGYSAGKFSDVDGNIMPWSRSTVADGKWLNREMILPFSGRDQYLLDSLNQTYDECSAFSGDLQHQITVIEARADVVDVVGSYEEFVNTYSAGYVPGIVSDKDVIKILNDETSGNSQTYYRWLSADDPATGTWVGVGSLEPCYHSVSFNNNILTVNNTNIERTYTLSSEKYIDFNGNDNHYTFGLNDDFISSASQCYTALTSHSASWDETSATLNENSGYWDQAYNWSKSSSADLILVSSTFVEYSGKWNDASATLYNNSANWQATYSAVSSNSAIWNETAYVPLSALECKIGSDNNVSDIAFAQGLSNTAEYTAFAQGITNNVTGNAFGQGTSNTAMTEALAQGTNNDAEINSFAQGKENTAISYSFAQGYKNEVNSVNEPLGISFAQGYANTADFISFAQGRANHADTMSFAQGSANTALENGFARGLRNHANGGFANGADNTAVGTGALAIGANNYAGNYAQALGHGVRMLGSTDSLSRGGMAIGTFNKTSAGLAFVIGNGLDDSRRSDLYWIDYNGNVFTNGNISAKNFYINGNPIDSIVSAKFSAYNGSNTLLTAYPISSFGLYANTAKYITVSTSNNNRLDFSVADALINSASSGYQAKQWINTNGDGIIGSAKSGAAASAWIVANGTTFMPKSQTFNAKGNPNNFNTTFSYTGFTLSAGSAIGFNKNGNTLTISAEAGIPDGTLTYTMMYSQGGQPHLQDFNISSLNISNYRSTSQSTDYINLNVTASNGATASFALWPEDTSLTSLPVPATLIPIVDPLNIKQKKYMKVSDLNIGNYVSAGDNQKLTIMSAENLTLANMQPGVIYLV